jgi:hypothetical protein
VRYRQERDPSIKSHKTDFTEEDPSQTFISLPSVTDKSGTRATATKTDFTEEDPSQTFISLPSVTNKSGTRATATKTDFTEKDPSQTFISLTINQDKMPSGTRSEPLKHFLMMALGEYNNNDNDNDNNNNDNDNDDNNNNKDNDNENDNNNHNDKNRFEGTPPWGVATVLSTNEVAPDGEYHAGNGICPEQPAPMTGDSWHPGLKDWHGQSMPQGATADLSNVGTMTGTWTETSSKAQSLVDHLNG